MPLIEVGRRGYENVDAAQRIRRSSIGSVRARICRKSRRSLVSMPMLAMMAAILLLGELTPLVPRNSSFVARDADDKEVAV